MVYNIGETVRYMSGDCDALISEKIGKITEISSDNFDDVVVINNKEEVPELKYWSKKTKSYRPVKEKDMHTIYYTMEAPSKNSYVEYVDSNMISGLYTS